MNYYKNQLDGLEDSDYFKKIVISDSDGNRTKTMDLNNESIPVLIDFLNREAVRLLHCRLITWIGDDRTAPVGSNIPYKEGSQLWHAYVDFACMSNREFTLQEVYVYHGLDKAWDTEHTAYTHYNLNLLNQLFIDGFIKIGGL